MRVDVVYFDGCPNHAPVVSLLREVAGELGTPIELREVRVTSPEEAARERMLGSPTVLVDGVDLEPGARSRRDYAMSCRLYPGERGLPPREMIAAALLGRNDASAQSDGAGPSCGCCA